MLSSFHPDLPRRRPRQDICILRRKSIRKNSYAKFPQSKSFCTIFSTLLYIVEKIVFKVLLLDQLKKFSHRKLCKNLYNVRQVKMIELLVSSGKPAERQLQKRKSLVSWIEKLIGGDGGAEKGRRVASYSQYPHYSQVVTPRIYLEKVMKLGLLTHVCELVSLRYTTAQVQSHSIGGLLLEVTTCMYCIS